MNPVAIERIFSTERTPVGYLCTATPPEILAAAGGYPFRMVGTGDNLENAESLAHPNLCGFCKSALAWARELSAARPICVVNATSCDGCRRLGPLLATLDGVSRTFSHDLPRCAEETDRVYFAGELRKLYESLAAALGNTADEATLNEAIEAYNAARAAFRSVLDAVMAGRLPVDAAFDVSEQYFVSLPEAFVKSVEQTLATCADAASERTGPRVLLAGNISQGASVARAIEDAGATLVGLDLCTIERAAHLDVQPGADPFRALADAVYVRPLCPRFEPAMDWVERVGRQALETGAKGVVLYSLKFCDNTLMALPMAREHLEKQGLTVLVLEAEYTAGLPGQMATRIEAFLEML